MRTLLPIVAVLLGASSFSSNALDIDMAAAQKWTAAKMVKYRVEGLHSARVPVVFGDYEGKADVTDRITLEFTWDTKKSRVIGAVTVTDGKSEVKNIKSDGTHCPPPQLKGEYEHFQAASNSMVGDLVQVEGIRIYPAASVSNYPASCSMRSIPGAKVKALLHVTGASPEVLAMPNMPGSPIVVAADRKSFSMKGAENWVWTFTPTLIE